MSSNSSKTNEEDTLRFNRNAYGKPRTPACPRGSKDIGPIISAPLDTKSYKATELANGMRAMLISTCQHELDLKGSCKYKKIQQFNKAYVGIKPNDPTYFSACCGYFGVRVGDNYDSPKGVCPGPDCGTEGSESKKLTKCCKGQASACITVGVGSFSDPVDVPGMAHLCEHCMLLGGSSIFTQEGSLIKLVHQCGGHINATTIAEYTYYYFYCNSSDFDTVLEAFSDMISQPLLKASNINKEVASVDSEFTLKQTCDFTRVSDFMGFLAKPDHPFSMFNWGNKQSLADKKLPEKMVAWHKKNYGSNFMTLCLQGPFPVEALEEMALKHFSSVPRSCAEHPRETLIGKGQPYAPENFVKIYHLVPVSKVKSMLISWCLPPDLWQDFQTNALLYLKTVLNTEGEGGICDYLRKKHWITRFASGCSKTDTMFRNSFASIYRFSIVLTDEGLKNRDQIVLALYSYIRFLIREGAQQRIYDELRRTQANIFHYHDWDEILECTLTHALTLQTVPPRFVLTSQTLITDYDAEKIGNLLNLLDPRKANIIVMAREFAAEQDLVSVMKGRFVYTAKPITQEMYDMLEKTPIYKEFKLPAPNTFLSKELGRPHPPDTYVKISEKMKTIHEDPDGRFMVTFVKDYKSPCHTRRLPYAVYDLGFHSPLATLENKSLMAMWVYLLNLFMGETINNAYQTLYQYHVNVVNDILKLQVEGPSFHLTELLGKVLDVFDSFEEHLHKDELYFEDEKAEQLDMLHNDMMDIENYPEDILRFILQQNSLSIFHQKQKLKRTNCTEFKRFVRRFRDQMFIDIESAGAVTSDQIETIKQSVGKIKFRRYPKPYNLVADRATLLPLGSTFLRIRVRDIAYHTSAVVNHYQFGALQDTEEIEMWELLCNVLVKTSFLKLRTEEQLGYRVRFELWQECGCHGLTFKVYTQADYYTTEHVNSRMDNFLLEFFKYHFKNQNAFKNLMSVYTKKPISYQLGKNMYTDFLLPGGKDNRKLSIQLVGYKSNARKGADKQLKNEDGDKPWLEYDEIPIHLRKFNDHFIQDIEEFKKSLELQPNLSIDKAPGLRSNY